ncbi:MAG: type II secretion system major pseudopilin GspG, partial [Thiovulaceae bacterium]|nr:type II secretion system major pseudopilin GspG [Sulfurimonadaceae bacterium]
KRKLVCVQMKGVSQTLKMFRLDNSAYPTTEEGLQALITNPSEEAYPSYAPSGYLEGKNLPKDSWKNEFIYINNGSDFDLISLGADRKEGGEGNDADIRFSECEF